MKKKFEARVAEIDSMEPEESTKEDMKAVAAADVKHGQSDYSARLKKAIEEAKELLADENAPTYDSFAELEAAILAD